MLLWAHISPVSFRYCTFNVEPLYMFTDIYTRFSVLFSSIEFISLFFVLSEQLGVKELCTEMLVYLLHANYFMSFTIFPENVICGKIRTICERRIVCFSPQLN